MHDRGPVIDTAECDSDGPTGLFVAPECRSCLPDGLVRSGHRDSPVDDVASESTGERFDRRLSCNITIGAPTHPIGDNHGVTSAVTPGILVSCSPSPLGTGPTNIDDGGRAPS